MYAFHKLCIKVEEEEESMLYDNNNEIMIYLFKAKPQTT